MPRIGQRLHWVLAATLLALLIIGSSANAQGTAPVSNLAASHIYGQQVTFTAELSPNTKPSSASLTFQVNGSGNSLVIPVEIQANNTLTAIYDTRSQNSVPAFSRLTYWFTLEFADGRRQESDRAAYTYSDNRYDWQTLSAEERFHVHWIEGDLAFGQALLDAVLNARGDYAIYLDLPYPEELDIYVYPENQALQEALEISNLSWAAGHANTAENTILTAIPTGFDQQLDIQRQIPHEITHIRLALYMGESYDNLPAWYNEGLGSIAEQYTAPSYWQLLQTAKDNDSLIPLSELCQGFPAEVSRAGLAYAQSDSFVRFLHNQYGKAGLTSLVDAYVQGQACGSGVQSVFGVSLDRLEADWYRETFDSGIIPRSIGEVLVWVLLLAVIIAGPIVLTIISARGRKGADQNVWE
jgi:hypothetical protein